MNREILFRGKHIHAMDSNEHLNGTWMHGYLSDKNYIYDKILDGEFLVDENTICQYTGLTDKNGKKIFEGDIVRFGKNYGEVKFGLHESNWQIYKYNQGFFVKFPKEYFRNELGYWRNKVVVVGNVYDNPELLEEENKQNMAKIFKISGYFVNANDGYTLKNVNSLILNGWDGLKPRHTHVEMEEIKDWGNNHPLLNDNCDLADCEKYFKRKVPVDNDRNVVAGQVYRHFKGKTVKVLHVAQDTEAPGQFYVVYKCEDGAIWSSPYGMFVSEVDRKKYPDVKQKYRFELMESENDG